MAGFKGEEEKKLPARPTKEKIIKSNAKDSRLRHFLVERVSKNRKTTYNSSETETSFPIVVPLTE